MNKDGKLLLNAFGREITKSLEHTATCEYQSYSDGMWTAYDILEAILKDD